jgi:hypothetical protein
MVYAGVIDCRGTFAHIGAIDGKTTDAIARCMVKLRNEETAPELAEDALLECLPKRSHDDARELLEEAKRFARERDASFNSAPERKPLSLEELMRRVEETEAAEEPGTAEQPSPAERTRTRGELLLQRETRPSLELAQNICGATPPEQPPYDAYVRAVLQRFSCRDGMEQLVRNDERAAELIAVCVLDQKSGDVPFQPHSFEQLYDCVPEQVHERVDAYVRDSGFWKRVSSDEAAAMLEIVEAELADGERARQPP